MNNTLPMPRLNSKRFSSSLQVRSFVHVLGSSGRETVSPPGVLYYLSATVNPLLYNLMSKRYRTSFKRTLCRWNLFPSRTSSLRLRSDAQDNRDSVRSPIARSPLHRLPRSNDRTSSSSHSRDHLLVFCVSKYKFVLGTRTISRRDTTGESRHRRSLHYRLSSVRDQDRQEEQERMKSHTRQRQFSLTLLHHVNRHPTRRLIITANRFPSLPPNTSTHDSRKVSQLHLPTRRSRH